MKEKISFTGVAQKFTVINGWVHIVVPKKYKKELKKQKRALGWGMYPITVYIGDTSWKTKLMMKKGDDFFIALRKDIRDKENISVGDKITISFKID